MRRLDRSTSAFKPPHNHPIVRHLSNASSSSSSTLTFLTARSASTDLWSTSGFIEEDPVMDDASDDEQDGDGDGDGDDDGLLEPKLEQLEDDDVHLGLLQPSESSLAGPGGTKSTAHLKRRRGRPRKHPLQAVDPSSKVQKGQKGRSKTGCITCRRRKKKCDETKPGCSNCKKNGVLCQGYQPLTIWKPKRDKGADDGLAHSTTRRSSMSLVESSARSSPFALPSFELAPIIHGIITLGDHIFLDCFCHRLSAVLTVEGPRKNAFKDMLLPLAVQHLGLMHSVLALASSNIEYHEPYGKSLLAKHGMDEGSIAELEERSEYHRVRALEFFHRSADHEKDGVVEKDAQAVRYAQMLCWIVQNLSEGERNGQHRVHLDAYRTITMNSKSGSGSLGIDEPFASFIEEYFRFHICLDDLISLPSSHRLTLGAIEDDWNYPSVIQPEAVRLLGVQDGLFYYMSKITGVRNVIRTNMEEGIDPIVDYASLFLAAEIDRGIRDWHPIWNLGPLRELASLLYKQMMWVYLWRTIYPPKTTTWQPEHKITEVVNKGLELLKMLPTQDPIQTLLLAPTFIIGCAAFDPAQRPQVRDSIANIKAFTHLKNTDRCLDVLGRVWLYMDEKDERSWDWQAVAKDMQMDFLPT